MIEENVQCLQEPKEVFGALDKYPWFLVVLLMGVGHAIDPT